VEGDNDVEIIISCGKPRARKTGTKQRPQQFELQKKSGVRDHREEEMSTKIRQGMLVAGRKIRERAMP
jgi:hypothetical protein